MINLLQSEFHYKIDNDLFVFEDKIGGHDEDAWKYHTELLLRKFI